jgi:hypothetical protein
VAEQRPQGPVAASPCPPSSRQQTLGPSSACSRAQTPKTAEQPPSPATGAGSARDRLRAGLLQRRAHSLTDSVSAEPPKPVVDVQNPAARQTHKSAGEKRGRSASFMDVLASAKRQCADADAQDNSSDDSSQENHLLAFVDGEEYKEEDACSEVLSLAVTPDGLWDGESSTPGSAVDGSEPFWGLDLVVDVELVQEVDAVDAALVDSWCC